MGKKCIEAFNGHGRLSPSVAVLMFITCSELVLKCLQKVQIISSHVPSDNVLGIRISLHLSVSTPLRMHMYNTARAEKGLVFCIHSNCFPTFPPRILFIIPHQLMYSQDDVLNSKSNQITISWLTGLLNYSWSV